MPKFKPILFNTEMVKAILEGRKTQTRRIAFPSDDLREFRNADYPEGWWYKGRVFKSFYDFLRYQQSPRCKYKPGDILWVRETWHKDVGRYMYRANYTDDEKFYQNGKEVELGWRPSIHMPKEAARIFLRVKDVRVERLQDMNEEAAIAEGFAASPAGTDSPLERFSALWDKTVKRDDLREYGYHANPWVWVIEFERIEKPAHWFLGWTSREHPQQN